MKSENTMRLEEIVISPASEPENNPYYPVGADAADREAMLPIGVVLRQLFRYAEDMGSLVREQERMAAQLRDAQRETLSRLALVAVHATAGGAAAMMRVGLMSALVAHDLGLADEYCDDICMAAPLRDIGLLTRQAPFASAPGQEDAGARQDDKKRHPYIGAAILGDANSPCLRMAEEIALAHHELFSGEGYPRGLHGYGSPMSARIVAVTARFDKLMRAEGASAAEVVAQLRIAAGTEFDPDMVEAMAKRAAAYPAVTKAVASSLDGAARSPDFLACAPKLWRQLLDL